MCGTLIDIYFCKLLFRQLLFHLTLVINSQIHLILHYIITTRSYETFQPDVYEEQLYIYTTITIHYNYTYIYPIHTFSIPHLPMYPVFVYVAYLLIFVRQQR